jgi:Phage tail tube protein
MASVSDSLRRFGGMYGAAYRDGFLLQEAIEVSGNVAIARIEVPLVGQTKMGYKPGRETREGTMRIQVIDSTWAMEVFQFLSQSLAQRRAARGTPAATLRAFDMRLRVDDPEAYDYEEWQVENVQVWQMPIGFAITDDIIQREIPITWEAETPMHVFEVNRTTGAVIDVTPASP